MSAPDRMALLAAFATPCPDCRQPILWAWTRASDLAEKIPLDAAPVANGNVMVQREGRRLVCDTIGSGAERRRLILGGWPLYVDHRRMSCPKSTNQARKGKDRRPEPLHTMEAPDEGLW